MRILTAVLVALCGVAAIAMAAIHSAFGLNGTTFAISVMVAAEAWIVGQVAAAIRDAGIPTGPRCGSIGPRTRELGQAGH